MAAGFQIENPLLPAENLMSRKSLMSSTYLWRCPGIVRVCFAAARCAGDLFLIGTLCLASGPAVARAPVDSSSSHAALKALERFLQDPTSTLAAIADQPFASQALTRQDAEQARDRLWKYVAERWRAERAEEMKLRQLVDGELAMPFYYRTFGDCPKEGRSLYISMHGGGGAPPQVNDQQWENQKRLYTLNEGVYVAPRAPTNTWNLWHQDHIDQFFNRLIQDMVLFEQVDSDRVYIMGYSAGGDGVFQLAPRMADRLAAAAMMAGHPNETSPLGLRNLPFTLHMGGRDGAYQRNDMARQWKERLAELQAGDPDGYVHLVKIYPDKGHWMDREDAAAIGWMAQYRRQRLPDRIVWKQDDVRHDRFYWLAVDPSRIEERAEVVATHDDGHFELQAQGVQELTILLSDQMCDLDQQLTVSVNGRQPFARRVQRTSRVIARTLAERGDPKDVYCAELTVALAP